jgi:hypothetical protein
MYMIIYRRFIPPPALTVCAADARGFDWLVAYRHRNEEKRRHAAELVDWEEEGGSLAAAAVASQSS